MTDPAAIPYSTVAALRHHEISESRHRILNPFTDEKLMLVGDLCRLQPDMRMLDLACGKAEMLCRFADRHGVYGVGVDLSKVFLAAARRRAAELSVTDRVTLVEADAAAYVETTADGSCDVVSCIGATWIGGGLTGTIELMKPALRPGGLLLVGEPYWIDPPPSEAYESLGFGEDDSTSLVGTLDRFASAGVDLVEMVLADGDSWDRYCAAQWLTLSDWLRDNRGHPDAGAVREFRDTVRRAHLAYGRRYLGWGVFVLRVNS